MTLMSRPNSLTGIPDTQKLAEYVDFLTVFGLGFAAVTYVGGVAVATAGPLYPFTPCIAGLLVCPPDDTALSTIGPRIGRRGRLALAAIPPLPLLGIVPTCRVRRRRDNWSNDPCDSRIRRRARPAQILAVGTPPTGRIENDH